MFMRAFGGCLDAATRMMKLKANFIPKPGIANAGLSAEKINKK